MKICKQCNIEYEDNMKFCPECGSKLEIKINECPNSGNFQDSRIAKSLCGKHTTEFGTRYQELQNEVKNRKYKKSSIYWIKDGVKNIPSSLLKGSSYNVIYIPSSVTTISKEAFADCINLKTIICESPQNIVVTSMKGMFANCRELTDITFLAEWNICSLKSTEETFKFCTKLQDISPLAQWDVSSVKVMTKMFMGCSSLKTLSALSDWNLRSIRDVSSMFASCKSLTTVSGISNWGTFIKDNKSIHTSGLLLGCDLVTDISPLKKWGYTKSYIYESLMFRTQTNDSLQYESSGSLQTDKTTGDKAIDRCVPNVFFIKAIGFVITYHDGKRQQMECGSADCSIPAWTGTGFLLADGRFVTARHVVEAWAFPSGGGDVDKNMFALNIIANNGGKVVARFKAVSSDGTQIHFSSDQCTIDRKKDIVSVTDEGAKLVVAKMSYDDTDYAYFNSGRSTGLPFNNNASTCLSMRTELVVLGFPLGIGANSDTDINPIFGSGIVARNGLQNGVILTTDTNYEQGNSGGPVFKENSNGELEVIGLVSAGAGRSMGFIVPIAAVK